MIRFPDQIIRSKGKSMNIVTVGIDLAKIYSLCMVLTRVGRQFYQAESSARQLLEIVAHLPPLPDRHGSLLRRHHWAKRIQPLRAHRQTDGPKFVTPYRMSGKRGRPTQPATHTTPRPWPTTASALVASLGGGHDFRTGANSLPGPDSYPANTAVAAKPD